MADSEESKKLAEARDVSATNRIEVIKAQGNRLKGIIRIADGLNMITMVNKAGKELVVIFSTEGPYDAGYDFRIDEQYSEYCMTAQVYGALWPGSDVPTWAMIERKADTPTDALERIVASLSE